MIVNQALGTFDIDPPPDENLANIPIVVAPRRFLSSVVGVRGGLVDDHSERTDGTIPSDQRSHSRRV